MGALPVGSVASYAYDGDKVLQEADGAGSTRHQYLATDKQCIRRPDQRIRAGSATRDITGSYFFA